MAKEVQSVLKLQMAAGQATPAPPVGPALGAAGVNEAIYSLLMMENRFIAASANITDLDADAEGFPIVRERMDDVDMRTLMSNSFGFGGTNACLIMRRFEG